MSRNLSVNDIEMDRMGAKELPGIGISIADMRLPARISVHYSGEVDNFLDHYARMYLVLRGVIDDTRSAIYRERNALYKIFHFLYSLPVVASARNGTEKKFDGLKHSIGYCVGHRPDEDTPDMTEVLQPETCVTPRYEGRIIFEIAKKAGLPKDMSVFADGHESGELLQKPEVMRQDLLQTELDKKGIPVSVRDYEGEAFADLAGFLALRIAKEKGDDSIRIPFFKTDAAWREEMGQKFGLELPIGPRPKPGSMDLPQ